MYFARSVPPLKMNFSLYGDFAKRDKNLSRIRFLHNSAKVVSLFLISNRFVGLSKQFFCPDNRIFLAYRKG
jgi:hypothetical protein